MTQNTSKDSWIRVDHLVCLDENLSRPTSLFTRELCYIHDFLKFIIILFSFGCLCLNNGGRNEVKMDIGEILFLSFYV